MEDKGCAFTTFASSFVSHRRFVVVVSRTDCTARTTLKTASRTSILLTKVLNRSCVFITFCLCREETFPKTSAPDEML